VGGDGAGDRLLDRDASDVAPAWDPARLHTLAYATGASIVLRDADSGLVVWRAPLGAAPTSLAWSSDGRLLAVASRHRIVVLGAHGRPVRTVSDLTGAFGDAAFRPGTHELAVSLRVAGRDEVKRVDVDHPGRARLLFAGPGAFGGLAWSPNGRWLLVSWPTANQWVFLHGARVRAVGNIAEQFPRAGAGASLRWTGPEQENSSRVS
jgi:hypothetical protein